MHHANPARHFRTDDDYGPGWRQSRRDTINDDVAPDDVSLLGPPTRSTPPRDSDVNYRARGRASDMGPSARRFLRSEGELADYGYAGQEYPIYGQPGRESAYDDPEPSWFADPTSSAYAFGYTSSLRPSQPYPGSGYPGSDFTGGHAGKGPRDYVRADSRIREDICDRLSDDDELDASDISVEVVQGEVVLSGNVPDRHGKRRAEFLSASVRGVVDVQNQLHVAKGLLRELSDTLAGEADREHHGHHGSGTRAVEEHTR